MSTEHGVEQAQSQEARPDWTNGVEFADPELVQQVGDSVARRWEKVLERLAQ